MRRLSKFCVVLGVMLVAQSALADVIATFGPVVNPASGNIRQAEAIFHVSGSNLVITLINTSPDAVKDPTDVLTALFFDTDPLVSFTAVSAVLGAGSSIVGVSPAPSASTLGHEWAFKETAGGLGGGVTQAIGVSAVGFGIFGPGDVFVSPAAKLAGEGTAPDGLAWGIVPSAGIAADANGGVTGRALINDSVVLTLGGLPAGFDLNRIENVRFQYGTAISETTVVPLPSGAWASVSLMGLIVAVRWVRGRGRAA